MKSFKDYVTMNEAFKKGDSVTIKNAKSYDAMMKDTAEGTVIGTMGSKVMVKVGSGQLNVDPKDLMLAEDSDVEDKDSLDEAKMYKSDYLSDSDVSYILQAVGVSWRDFEKRVKDAIQKYLEMTLGNIQRITVTRANIDGYMFSQGSTRLLVDEILYEFRLDGESHQGAIKKQEIWVNL